MFNIQIVKPMFKDGVLLTTESMQTLSDYIFSFQNLKYQGYSNGIISGFDISVVDKSIIVGKGLFKYNNNVFLLENEVEISYEATNTLTYLKLSFVLEERKLSGAIYEFRIELSEEKPLDSDIELCRYKLQKGARLRYIYDGFDDMITEFDTINLIHSHYAAIGMPTLHSQVVKGYATELLSISPQNPLDQSFCILALSGEGVLTADSIANYIRLKADIPFEKINNHRMYRELNSILMGEKSRVKAPQKKPIERRKIIVD